jgi:predicted small metal-binding protein
MKRVACRNIGLDCDYIIEGETEEELTKNALKHAWDNHAIKADEMTSEMKAKIKDNIYAL